MTALDPLVKGYLTLRPAAAARTLGHLDGADIRAIFEVMPRQLAVSVLQHMPAPSAARSLGHLPNEMGAEILSRAPVLSAIAVLRLIKRDQVKALLAAMPRSAGARLRMRLRYPETIIGAFVDPDVVTLAPDHRVGDALRLFRRAGRRTGHAIFVLDERRHLQGVLDLSELLAHPDRTVVQRIMRPAPVVLNARAAIQTVSNHPAWLTQDSLPVINRDGVFQGVLQRTVVMEDEQPLLTEIAARSELATTRGALADIFWMGVGALFVGRPDPQTRDKVED